MELSGFRGFRETTRIDFAPGFVVLTGRNGAGKSTVLDAIDFVLTGTIDKFAVTNAKGGGLASHIWWVGEGIASRQYVRVAFADDRGQEFVLTRGPSGAAPHSDEAANFLCSPKIGETWPRTLVDTTLIRDETITKLSLDLPGQARFQAVRSAIGALAGSDWSNRTAAILDAAKAAKAAQSQQHAKAQAELGHVLSSLTEARSAAERQFDVAEAEDAIRRLAPDLDLSSTDITARMRRRIADRKQSIQTLRDLIARSEKTTAEASRLASPEAEEERKRAALRVDELSAQGTTVSQEIAASKAALEAERQADQFAANMMALLIHGEEIGLVEGHCPLCDAVRSNEEFAAAIAAAKGRLAGPGLSLAHAQERSTRARQAKERFDRELDSARAVVAALQSQHERNRQEIDELNQAFRTFHVAASATSPDEARRLVLLRQQETAELEHALFILEASAAHDRVAALEARIETLRMRLDEEDARSTAAEKALETARLIDNAAKSVANQVLAEQFDTVMPLLKELYQRLRPHAEWREIETDFGGKVRATLDFTVGEGRNPQFLFSSGQRRAAGLAFLLSIHLSRPWSKLQTLMLDDPVQHIDDFRALNLVEVLAAIRKLGRQVIVAVEDPLLADLLCRRLRGTPEQGGRRYDLAVDASGSATIEQSRDIGPLPTRVLDLREAS